MRVERTAWRQAVRVIARAWNGVRPYTEIFAGVIWQQWQWQGQTQWQNRQRVRLALWGRSLACVEEEMRSSRTCGDGSVRGAFRLVGPSGRPFSAMGSAMR